MKWVWSPMEQFIIYPIISFNFSINNVIFFIMISAFISVSLTITHRGEIVATWWGILNESQYRTIQSMVENYIGSAYTVYMPLIYTLFHIILFCNLQGTMPYSTTSTVEVVMTLSLSFTQLVGTLQIGFMTHRLQLQSAFLPAGTPLGQAPLMIFLEALGYLTKIQSLGLRLAINLITGHVLVKTILSFIYTGYMEGTSIIIQSQPLFLLTQFQALEILIAYLQAYIFSFITCITIKDMATTGNQSFN